MAGNAGSPQPTDATYGAYSRGGNAGDRAWSIDRASVHGEPLARGGDQATPAVSPWVQRGTDQRFDGTVTAFTATDSNAEANAALSVYGASDVG